MAMKFDDDTCSKNLRSLMQKNYKVLQRINETESPSFQESDIFIVNDDFNSQAKRVVLPTPVLEEAYKKEII